MKVLKESYAEGVLRNDDPISSLWSDDGISLQSSQYSINRSCYVIEVKCRCEEYGIVVTTGVGLYSNAETTLQLFHVLCEVYTAPQCFNLWYTGLLLLFKTIKSNRSPGPFLPQNICGREAGTSLFHPKELFCHCAQCDVNIAQEPRISCILHALW